MSNFVEVPPSEWKELVNKPVSDSKKITVHVCAWREGNVILVFNPEEKKSDDFVKPSGCGVPTGGVDPGETPFKAAERELKEETGLSDSDFEMNSMPFQVTKKDNGHINVWFLAKLDSGVELPETVNDPSCNITKKPEWFNTLSLFNGVLDDVIKEGNCRHNGERIYTTHLRAIHESAYEEFEAVEV